MGMVNIDKIRDDHKVIYELSGRIDTQSAPDLQDEIDDCFAETEREYENKIELVLDFKDVQYMSSAGLRTVLYTKKKVDKMAEGSKMEIINIQPDVMEVFNMTGFTDFLPLNPI